MPRPKTARSSPAPGTARPGVFFDAHPKQVELWRAIKSRQYKYLCFGGAVGGGKSYAALGIIFALCELFPGSRWGIVRKGYGPIRRNLLPTFQKLRAAIPHVMGDVNMQSWSAVSRNGSEILFISENFDQDKELHHFDGLEVNGFVFEEASELQEQTWHKAVQRAGRWHVPNIAVQPPVLMLATTNPTQNFIKRIFYDPWAAGTLKAPYFYLPSKVTDNPHLSADYHESLRSLPPELYRQFVEGDWNTADDPHAIIPYQAVHACVERDPMVLAASEGEEALGIDVAELGSDLSALAHMRGDTLYELAGWQGALTGASSDRILPRIASRRIAADKIGVDAIGVGAGVYSDLVRAGLNVRRIAFGGAPIPMARDKAGASLELQFDNLKAQMWWKLREDFIAGAIRIPAHEGLIQDLVSVRYTVRGERKIAVEDKASLRKRIGRSTDYADALVIANFVRSIAPVRVWEAVPERTDSDPLASAGGLTSSLYDY